MATNYKQALGVVEDVWPAPDLSVLSAGRRSPPPFPREMFGGAFGVLEDLADGAGSPVDYIGLSFLSVCASLIGGKRKVKPYAITDWTEPCILWTGLVGDPSSGKSPALDRTTVALRLREKDHAEAHQDRVNEWRGDCERAKAEFGAYQAQVKEAVKEKTPNPKLPDAAVEPKEPQRRRLLVQDSTPEMLAQILSGNPSGTRHLRDELSGWLTSFDRYTPGGRDFWIEAYGGRPFVIDRKGSPEPTFVPFNGVSVTGGIQPEKLADALLGRGKPDDGLVARFLWAWPDRRPYQRPTRCGDPAALSAVYGRLDALDWGVGPDCSQVPIVLPLDPDAEDLFSEFERENSEANEDSGGLFKSFCGKLPGTLARLALISELTRWAFEGGPEPRSISSRAIGAAADFIDGYAKPSALRVYGDAGLPPVERHAALLARYVRRHSLRRLNARDIYRNANIPGLRDAEPTNEALSFLVEADWLRPAGSRAGSSPGRQSADYIVNPLVHGG
jgi:putative DNA primase/helicase